MDPVDAMVLQAIDLRVLGDRLRAARLARGWTQTDLAGELVSVGYVSRLESGQRRPNTAVLESLASRLDIAIDELLRGPTAREQDAIRLSLDFAELSLETGDTIEGEARARDARDRARSIAHTEMADRAQYLVARALEQQGSIDDAILELEPLVTSPVGSLLSVKATIALSRCYRESGDLSLAIDLGERILIELSGTPLDSTDEAVQLAVTVAAAYYERGDTGQAVRTCR
ncbi:MAG: helix-turn-helix domain-containing protein, partial [Nocardioides sp.]